ncbi:signal peptide peptidase SppA [Vampirovibrio sp.]|uniref:signal peptide peptidase SppA n=1 Tax=Vampirovibrio sp. TaxID=2717857 RepID=UPI003593EF29
MNTQFTSRKVALGLLVFSLLALLIGTFNATRLSQEATKTQKSEGGANVSALLTQKAHLALLDLSGPITMDAGNDNGLFQSESNAVTVRKALDKAAKNDSIKGVLLRINSPGGTVGMSQELNEAVKRVSKKKPVVVSMGDLAASGGYYTACAADLIVTNPGTLTASIGVIISTVEFSELMNNKLGIHAVTVKSGKFKDLLSPYRKPRPEEVALIQTIIDDSYQDFLNTVISGRTRFITDTAEKTALIAKIKAVADGRVVTGRQALSAGLADKVGDQDLAHTELDRLAKERFHLKGKDRLPLEADSGTFSMLEFLGLKSESLLNPTAKDPAALAAKMLPFSMRYANQPLWILE